MSLNTRTYARRFITLIDALYESKTVLILSSAVPINDLFPSSHNHHSHHDTTDITVDMDNLSSSLFQNDEEIFAFQRCVSRLVEMQSKKWVEQVPEVLEVLESVNSERLGTVESA